MKFEDVAIFHCDGKHAWRKTRLRRAAGREMEFRWSCCNIVGVTWSGLGAEFLKYMRVVDLANDMSWLFGKERVLVLVKPIPKPVRTSPFNNNC